MNGNSKALFGLILGAAAGVAVGLLMAPQSGDRTRKKIKKASRKLANTLVSKAEDAVEAGNGQVTRLQAKLKQFI
jgi:gas vesicle protein